MKDYIQQLIELFGHNNYSADTHNTEESATVVG